MLKSTYPKKLSSKENSRGIHESHCEWEIEQILQVYGGGDLNGEWVWEPRRAQVVEDAVREYKETQLESGNISGTSKKPSAVKTPRNL